MAATLKEAIRERARALGFDAVRFAAATGEAAVGRELAGYLAAGCHGDMAWMADTAERRAAPEALWPEARTVIVLGSNYGPRADPRVLAAHRERGAISVYAQNRDYHDTVKKRLKRLGRWLAESQDCAVKVFVDTAPVMEKPLAQRAGLGWQGKHTNLVSRGFGSWLFLGEVFTTLALPADPPHPDLCGSCDACLDACPTGAFLGPHRIDARRCISYLTIEHKGHIAAELRPLMGNHVYGCDDCLAACPWNKFTVPTAEPDYRPRAELAAPALADLAELDDTGFRAVFAGSPVKRLGRDRFVRNVLIAIGNSGRSDPAAVVQRRLADPSPLVRAMAVWALARLAPPSEAAAWRMRLLPSEDDLAVQAEWMAIPGVV